MTRRLKQGLGGVAALALIAALAAPAHAGWWHSSGGSSGGWWGGSSGGWGSSGGRYWGSNGGWGSSGGSHGGLFHRWHHRHHWHRWHGSSGGWGSSGGSSGGWGSSGGSSGGTYYYAPVEKAPAAEAPPEPPAPMGDVPPAAPPPAGESQTGLRRADGMLMVEVPPEARIFVNGRPTTSTGTRREYVSRNLKPGFSYSYEVRAEIIRDGQVVEETKTIDLKAGQVARLAFDLDAPQKVETTLTVHVPADAKVYLAGNETTAKGQTRVFRTTGLRGDLRWDDYTVKVEVERGGRTIVEEKKVSLKAGDAKELTFDFEADKVADARP